MKKAKFTVGDKAYVYDQDSETFKHIEIKYVKIDEKGNIFYNGRFNEEIVFATLKESFIDVCDNFTMQYIQKIKKLIVERDKLCCKEN